MARHVLPASSARVYAPERPSARVSPARANASPAPPADLARQGDGLFGEADRRCQAVGGADLRAEVRHSAQLAQHRQTGGQATSIVQRPKQIRGALVVVGAAHGVAGVHGRQSEQVQRFGHAATIADGLENRQRLLVASKRLQRLANVHLPVGEAVETPSQERRISDLAQPAPARPETPRRRAGSPAPPTQTPDRAVPDTRRDDRSLARASRSTCSWSDRARSNAPTVS